MNKREFIYGGLFTVGSVASTNVALRSFAKFVATVDNLRDHRTMLNVDGVQVDMTADMKTNIELFPDVIAAAVVISTLSAMLAGAAFYKAFSKK